jgi:MFS family permease
VNISVFFIAVAAVIIWQTFKGRKSGHFQKTETHSCLSGSATSTHVGAMVLGRFIVGLGLGLSSPVTSMYVSEVLLQPTTLHGYVSLAKKHGNWMVASSSIQHECFLILTWFSCIFYADITSISAWYIWQSPADCILCWDTCSSGSGSSCSFSSWVVCCRNSLLLERCVRYICLYTLLPIFSLCCSEDCHFGNWNMGPSSQYSMFPHSMQKNSGGFWNCAVELGLANFVSRWRACFWISTVPACLLALGMEFCAESPRWLFKVIAACLMVVFYAYDVYVLLSWSKYGIQGRELLLIEVLSQMLWPAIRMV